MVSSSTATGRSGSASATPSAKRMTPRSGPVVHIKPVVAEADTDVVRSMLDRYEFRYELVRKVSIADIDRKKSQLNQARISHPIDEDQVLLYAEAMKNGDVFPPVVAYKSPTGCIIMDGNHRAEAADLADLTVDVYVVKDPTPAQIQSFTYEANTKHGMPTSLPDRLRQAIHLINKGVSAASAAKQLGLPINQLRHAIDQYQAEKRFESLGVKKFATLSQTARRRLDSIHSDVALRAAADLVLDASLTGDDLTGLVKEVNGIRSEREQLARIAGEREARANTIRATASGRVPVPQSLVTFARMTSTLNRMDVEVILKNLHDVPQDIRLDYAHAASESVTRLMEIIREARRGEAS